MDVSNYIKMYDSTNPNAIHELFPDAQAAAAYCDLSYGGTYAQLVDLFPELHRQGRLVPIAGLKTTRARIYDIEQGNPMLPEEVPDAVKESIAAGFYRPGPYASKDLLDQCQAALEASGLQRHEYVLWLADWDGVAEIPQYDAAKQIKNEGQYDLSVCRTDFFPPLTHPRARGKAFFKGWVDFDNGEWDVQGEPGSPQFGTDDLIWKTEIGVSNQNGHWTKNPLPFGK